MSVSFRSVSIDSLKKGRDSGATPASQSEHLCRTNANLSDKGTARCCLATTKIRVGESLTEVLKSLRYGLRGRVFPGAILQPCGRQNKPSVRTRADIGTEAFYPVVYCGRKEFFIIRILEFIALWQLLRLYPQR